MLVDQELLQAGQTLLELPLSKMFHIASRWLEGVRDKDFVQPSCSVPVKAYGHT